MEKGKKLSTVGVNVKMMYEIVMSLRCYQMAIIYYIVMHSKDGIFQSTKRNMAKSMGISERTVSRYMRALEDESIIEKISPHEWKPLFWFAPDEVFERVSGAEKGTCFFFLDEVDEDEPDISDEEFEENFNKAMELWNSLPKYNGK